MSIKKKHVSGAAFIAWVVLLVAAATVGAATISGTAGNDTLRGGAKADRLNGKGGNDKLFGAAGNDVLNGGPGNDVLLGGPGADKLACGQGQDVARGDSQDKISTDCEIVKGLPAPEPPAPPAPPPAPAPPAPPPATPVTVGSYRGLLDGNFIFFEVTSDRTVSGFRSNYIREDCNDNLYIYGTVSWGSTHYQILADATFAFSGTGTGTIDGSPATFNDAVTGRFDGTSATGTYTANSEFDYKGTHYRCTSGTKSWTAALLP